MIGRLLVVSQTERDHQRASQRQVNGTFVKKAKLSRVDELRPEYKRSDFGEIVRGKYARRIGQSTNVVVLAPEVAKAFPNDKAVNDTLRSLLKLAQGSSPKRTPKRVRGTA